MLWGFFFNVIAGFNFFLNFFNILILKRNSWFVIFFQIVDTPDLPKKNPRFNSSPSGWNNSRYHSSEIHSITRFIMCIVIMDCSIFETFSTYLVGLLVRRLSQDWKSNWKLQNIIELYQLLRHNSSVLQNTLTRLKTFFELYNLILYIYWYYRHVYCK